MNETPPQDSLANPYEAICVRCGGDITKIKKFGPQRKFCSDACRKDFDREAYRLGREMLMKKARTRPTAGRRP